jgi:hypothetical protein
VNLMLKCLVCLAPLWFKSTSRSVWDLVLAICYSNGIKLSIQHEVENNLLIIPSNPNLASEYVTQRSNFVSSMKKYFFIF